MNKKQALRDEKLFAAYDQIKFLREQVEFLRELVESQNLHLQYKQQQLEEVEQELQATNQDLCIALMPEASHPFRGDLPLASLAHSTLFKLSKAQELQQTISKIQKSASESVALLHSIINGEEVKPEKLHKMDKINFQINPLNKDIAHEIVAHSKKLRTHSQELETRYKELGCHFITLKSHYTRFHKNWTPFRKITK